MGVGGQHHALAALPPWKNLYPLYRRMGGPQGPPGFDPRTVQPVASRYTHWTIAAATVFVGIKIYSYIFTFHMDSVILRFIVRNWM